MKTPRDCDPILIERVIGAAIHVHRELGPGLREVVYERALSMELQEQRIRHNRQVEVPVIYRGKNLGLGFQADFVIEDSLLLEIKSVSEFSKFHLKQTINYLRLLNIKRSIMMNFNVTRLVHGLKRVSI